MESDEEDCNFILVEDPNGKSRKNGTGIKIFRSNLKCESDINKWIQDYTEETFTGWIVSKVQKEKDCKRMIVRKTYECHFSKKNKKDDSKRNTCCKAFIDIKVKKVNKATRRNDSFLKQDPPLQAVIAMQTEHNHYTHSFDALQYLRAPRVTREKFKQYFADGNGVAASMRIHENSLTLDDDDVVKLTNSYLNPNLTTVQHWYRLWREEHYGEDFDPIWKLEERTVTYKKDDVYLGINRDKDNPSLWGAMIVTPLMDRVQRSPVASEIIFIDTTSSCDTTECSLTLILAACAAGAVPLAICLHNSQSIQGYDLIFSLLFEYNPKCFGDQENAEALMSDKSGALKGSFQKRWPAIRQLLCHFHVGQAEWDWLLAAKNKILAEHRQLLMKAFQQIMYAKDTEQFKTALVDFDAKCSYSNYTKRVRSELDTKEEWVLMFRDWLLTRGNNTDNYSEANIRVMKDIVLERTRALNPVALADFVVYSLDPYFKSKLLRFACNRVRGPYLKYEKLVKKMPDGFEEKIQMVGDNVFEVPSASNDGTSYEIHADIGICSCFSGRQGSFCKHQALVHKVFPNAGLFPNAPATTCESRYMLGCLALGKKCPPIEYFRGLKDNLNDNIVQLPLLETLEVSNSENMDFMDMNDSAMETVNETGPSNAVVHCSKAVANAPSQCPSDSEAAESSPALQEDMELDTQPLKDLVSELDRMYQVDHSAFSKSQINKITQRLKLIRSEGQVAKALYAIANAIPNPRQRKHQGYINTQPKSRARRKDGKPRGAKRLPAGRPREPGTDKRKKRRHCMAANIAANVPTAKSHH